MIQTELVLTEELRQRDVRLDGSYYCSAGAKARKLFAATKLRTQSLDQLCIDDGLYIPYRFKRPYVRDPKQGTPYVTGSAINLADPLQGCDYLSSNPHLLRDRARLMLRRGMILITCSGDIGNTVYVNQQFDNTIGSPDLLRVIPDTEKIRPGYLYAYLASPMGRGLLAQGTYGGVIMHIEASHVLDLPVPRLEDAAEQAIHDRIEQAVARRATANDRLLQADSAYLGLVGLASPGSAPEGPLCFAAHIGNDLLRFDAPYHRPTVVALRGTLSSHEWHSTLGAITLEIFHPFRMNMRYVEPQHGIPFINGGDIIDMRPRPVKWISRDIYGTSRFLVKRGWSLTTNAGTIGFHTYVGRALDGVSMAQHVARLVPDETRVLPPFLYAIVRSPLTQLQMKALIYGSVIDTVLESHMATILVACPGVDQQREVACLVAEAFDLRDEANDLEDEAQAMLKRAIDAATRRNDRVAVGE